MGIFDLFTGAPAKQAAEQNRTLLDNSRGLFNSNQAAGTGILQQGQTDALGALNGASDAYSPLAALGTKYGQGTSLYQDSLGINGPAGNARATGAFQAGPGYQFAVDQALDGINRHAAATGAMAGGNTLAALSDRAGNMANQEYGSWQDRLQGFVNPELSATGAVASGRAGIGTQRAGVIQNTAGQLVNLGNLTTSGQSGLNNSEMDVNNQVANAQMQGSSNLWGLGMNLAKLGVGAATGGTSLLGTGGLAKLRDFAKTSGGAASVLGA